MNKLFGWLLGIIIIGIIFVLGRGYGEKKTGDQVQLGFTTQSVDSATKPWKVVNKGNLKIYKMQADPTAEPVGANTDFVECPGAKLSYIELELGVDPSSPRLIDPTTKSQINTYGLSLNFLATPTTMRAKFLKAARTNPLAPGMCVYGILNNQNKPEQLMVFDVKLVDGCKAGNGGFDCNKE
ncbi:MAG TPA: hypothetical protein PLW93_03310 [Candidatus Absconditabacterales bacterium]|nr:hypothetical protein [Candidatus Absconditabacterales bacterium]HNG97276.1 hypothetical protein [Candidatus Absconditabacterales bacterium]